MANGNGTWIKYITVGILTIGFFTGVGMNWNKIIQVDKGFADHKKEYVALEKRDDRQDCDIVELKGDIKEIRKSQARIETDLRDGFQRIENQITRFPQ